MSEKSMQEKNENTGAVRENRMGTMPVGRLLAVMSLPTMFSMLIQALYNVVDSIFVSRVSEAALTSVSLAFPLQTLMISFAVGTATGVCSVISRRLGERREEEARKTAETGYVLALVLACVFVLVGIFLTNGFFRLYTADAELISMGDTYLSICLIASLGCFVATFTEKSLQGTGDTFHPMIIQGVGAVFNVIFDPILIFGYLGFPAMGVAGAAIATVAGQWVSMFLGIFFIKRSSYVNIRFTRPAFYKESAKSILQVGLPSTVMQGMGTIMTSLMNGILITYNVLATTVFGIYFKLQSFFFMPVFGLNNGLMPILGYNYGAKNRERMLQAFKLGHITAFVIMTAGMLLFNLFPDVLLGLFNASPNLRVIGETALRRASWAFPLAAFSIIFGALFQAMGDGYLSMITSIVRQIVFLVPLAWLLGKLGGLDAIWLSFLFAEVFALALSIVFFMKERKKFSW